MVEGNHVIQVHSTGAVFDGIDDRGISDQESDLLRVLTFDAYENNLHSQQYGRSGVRWPEN